MFGSVTRKNVCHTDAPSVRDGVLLVQADLLEDRHDLADRERDADEDRDEDHRRQREDDLDPAGLEERREPPAAGRTGSRQARPTVTGDSANGRSTSAFSNAPAAEPLPDEHPRHDDAENGRHEHRDDRDDGGQLEGVQDVGLRERVRDGRRARASTTVHDDARSSGSSSSNPTHSEATAAGCSRRAAPASRRTGIAAVAAVALTRRSLRAASSRPVTSTSTNEIANSSVATAAASANRNWPSAGR